MTHKCASPILSPSQSKFLSISIQSSRTNSFLYVLIYCIYNPDRTDTQGAGFLLWTKRKRICRKEIINRGAAKPLFSALQDLIDPGILVQLQQEVSSLFDQGDIAMMAMWEMYAGYLTDEQFENTGYFAFPGMEAGMTGTLDGHEYLLIPKSAENPELAAEYIRYVASYENTKLRSIVDKSIPVYSAQFNDQEIIDALPYLPVIDLVKKNLADQFPPITTTYELRHEAAKQIHPALLGEISVKEAVEGLQEFADDQEAVPQ